MFTEINAALQSAKVIKDIVVATNSMSNHSEILTAITTIQEKLADAIGAYLESEEKQAVLRNRLRELEQEVLSFKNWETTMQRYQLVSFPTGTLAYAFKPDMQNHEPQHHLCEVCVNKQQISRLQPIGDGYFLMCHNCKLQIQITVLSGAMLRSVTAKMKQVKS